MPTASCESVRVVVQARPLLPFETLHGAFNAVQISNDCHVHVSRPLVEDLVFSAFDAAYAANTGDKPDVLYDKHVQPLVDSLFQGLNATVFAYGQTSAGKSYTMGYVTKRVAESLFEMKRKIEAVGEDGKGVKSVTIRVGFVEIYREKIRDLVDGGKGGLGVVNVQVRERAGKGVFLDGARERIVAREDDLIQIVKEGALVRQTASTGMNACSSRSHSVITLTVQIEGDGACLSGKMHLVDLAGSERVKRTAVEGERFTEGVEINKGLFALAKVISALADSAAGRGIKQHVPYRDSKLTRLLQDSLGGNARTLLVACVSPADTSREETLGTLRYAERAKCIRNRPKVNTEKDAVEVSDLRSALARARAEIASLAAENERLRKIVGRPRAQREVMFRGEAVSRMDSHGSSEEEESLYSSSPMRGPHAITREDGVIKGLKHRIMMLEGVLDRVDLGPADKEALLNTCGEERVLSHLQPGKLRSLGLAALSHIEGGESRKRRELRSRLPYGSRRRGRMTRVEENAIPLPRKGSKKLGLDACASGQRNEDEHETTETEGSDFASQSASARLLQRQERPPYGRAAYGSPCKSNDEADPPSEILFLDSKESEAEGEEGASDGPCVEYALAKSRLEGMRRTFLERLRDAETDKCVLENKRIQAMKEVSVIQKRHERELEEVKTSYNSRLADIRTKLVDVKRLEAESTRLTKQRDGSDASRKKLAAKLKYIEKERDEATSKLAETLNKSELTKRKLGKENRSLAKAERSLRMELRRCETGKSRQEALVNRLRMENEAMKLKLRNSGQQQVRRVNSGITPTTSSRTPAAC